MKMFKCDRCNKQCTPTSARAIKISDHDPIRNLARIERKNEFDLCTGCTGELRTWLGNNAQCSLTPSA